MAVCFVAATVAAFAIKVAVPAISDHQSQKRQTQAGDKDRNQRDALAAKDRKIASLTRRVAVSRLLFDHFFGKDARQQRAVVAYLSIEFRTDFVGNSLVRILDAGALPEVKPAIKHALTSAKRLPTRLERVNAKETAGFAALAGGDLLAAKTAFTAAYAAFPTYHSVDEILHKVLVPATDGYARATSAQRQARLARALDDVLTLYSWGMPKAVHTALEAEQRSLR